jgi:hypothetical protein
MVEMRRDTAIVGANVMTIGDFLNGGKISQEIFEIRLENGQKARRILRDGKVRERNLLATLEAKELTLGKLYRKAQDLKDKKLPPNHPAVKRVEEAIKSEKIRLQASTGYAQVLDNLKQCKAIQMRAKMDLDVMPDDIEG